MKKKTVGICKGKIEKSCARPTQWKLQNVSIEIREDISKQIYWVHGSQR